MSFDAFGSVGVGCVVAGAIAAIRVPLRPMWQAFFVVGGIEEECLSDGTPVDGTFLGAGGAANVSNRRKENRDQDCDI